MKPTALMLVDDHALVRDTLAQRLSAEPDLTVVASADNAQQALELAQRLEPDVILFDIDMPGLCCFSAARLITERYPLQRILFLSAFSHDAYISEALSAGAAGYITKREPYEEVARAIRSVAAGDAFFSPEIRDRIVVDGGGVSLRSAGTRADSLTTREREVLRYLAGGLSKKEIANLLFLSVNTIDVHTSRIMGKLDIHDRVMLARFAIREGLAEA